MQLTLSRAALSLSILLQPVLGQKSVRFFYSPLLDSCEWGSSNTFPATNNTSNGGLCAFIPDTSRLYACPAPDPTCWTFQQNCKGGQNSAGSDQIVCTGSGATWCCANYETCTVTPNQINICISNFTSPNSGVSASQAQAKEYSALPSALIGTSAPTGTPSAFSTRQLQGSTSSSSSPSSSTSSASSSSSSSSSSTSAAAPSSSSSSNGGLSGGAIAGIIVGIVAAIGIITAAVVFLILNKRRTAAKAAQTPIHEKPASEYYGPQGAHNSGYHGPVQQGGETYAKVGPEEPQELSAAQPAHELP